MKTTVPLALLPFVVLAHDFEQRPTLSAAAILKPEFGTFEGDGNAMQCNARAPRARARGHRTTARSVARR
jgi:hypothetical protein